MDAPEVNQSSYVLSFWGWPADRCTTITFIHIIFFVRTLHFNSVEPWESSISYLSSPERAAFHFTWLKTTCRPIKTIVGPNFGISRPFPLCFDIPVHDQLNACVTNFRDSVRSDTWHLPHQRNRQIATLSPSLLVCSEFFSVSFSVEPWESYKQPNSNSTKANQLSKRRIHARTRST